MFEASKLLIPLIGTQEDVDLAMTSARKAYETWSQLPGHVRARHMYSIARHVQKHARLISVLESLDNGKSIRESRDCDIPLVARHFYHHAGVCVYVCVCVHMCVCVSMCIWYTCICVYMYVFHFACWNN